jgi:hypothetical protein
MFRLRVDPLCERCEGIPQGEALGLLLNSDRNPIREWHFMPHMLA